MWKYLPAFQKWENYLFLVMSKLFKIKGDRKYHLECQISKIVKPLPDVENKIKPYWSKVLGICTTKCVCLFCGIKTNEWMKEQVISPVSYSVTSKERK